MHKLLLALLLPLAACASSTKVTVDYDRQFDFTAPTTFAWTAGEPARSELNERRIVAGVEAALEQRGLRLTEGGQPDLLIATEVSTSKETRSSPNIGIGLSRAIGFGSIGVGTSTGRTYKQVDGRLLTIDLFSAEDDRLVWRAEASFRVADEPEETEARITAAVERAFAKYPPDRAPSR